MFNVLHVSRLRHIRSSISGYKAAGHNINSRVHQKTLEDCISLFEVFVTLSVPPTLLMPHTEIHANIPRIDPPKNNGYPNYFASKPNRYHAVRERFITSFNQDAERLSEVFKQSQQSALSGQLVVRDVLFLLGNDAGRAESQEGELELAHILQNDFKDQVAAAEAVKNAFAIMQKTVSVCDAMLRN